MKKILIVDDSPFFRRLLKDELISSNVLNFGGAVDIIEADDKPSALDQVQKNKPDLILLDIVMRDNEREGIQILEDVRQNYPNIKVIIITSVGQNSVISKCKSLGVSDYIGKPFDSAQLEAAIKNTLS